MKYLLDTDTRVYWLRGHAGVQARIAQTGPGMLALSIITLAERS
jgi:predicted nucleic acid-binding protein